jgi:hypothetical protein
MTSVDIFLPALRGHSKLAYLQNMKMRREMRRHTREMDRPAGGSRQQSSFCVWKNNTSIE